MKTGTRVLSIFCIMFLLAAFLFVAIVPVPSEMNVASAAPLYAATPVAVQEITPTGLAPSYTAAYTDGNTFANDGFTFAHIKNTSGSVITATFTTPITVNGLAVSDLTVQIPATTGDKMIGPFNVDTFNDSTGKVTVTWSSPTNVTLAAIKW